MNRTDYSRRRDAIGRQVAEALATFTVAGNDDHPFDAALRRLAEASSRRQRRVAERQLLEAVATNLPCQCGDCGIRGEPHYFVNTGAELLCVNCG
jgi:hypothetical protein